MADKIKKSPHKTLRVQAQEEKNGSLDQVFPTCGHTIKSIFRLAVITQSKSKLPSRSVARV